MILYSNMLYFMIVYHIILCYIILYCIVLYYIRILSTCHFPGLQIDPKEFWTKMFFEQFNWKPIRKTASSFDCPAAKYHCLSPGSWLPTSERTTLKIPGYDSNHVASPMGPMISLFPAPSKPSRSFLWSYPAYPDHGKKANNS